MGSGQKNDGIFILQNNVATEKNFLRSMDLEKGPNLNEKVNYRVMCIAQLFALKKGKQNSHLCNYICKYCRSTDKCGEGSPPNS